MSSVELPRPLANQLLHYAQVHAEQQLCGIISSKQGVPFECYPVSNAATEPQHRFNMDEAELINTLRTLREQGEELFAIFHSHPNAPALPSAIDLAEDQYPDTLKLIISLNTIGVLEMQAFHTPNGEIEPVELLLAH